MPRVLTREEVRLAALTSKARYADGSTPKKEHVVIEEAPAPEVAPPAIDMSQVVAAIESLQATMTPDKTPAPNKQYAFKVTERDKEGRVSKFTVTEGEK